MITCLESHFDYDNVSRWDFVGIYCSLMCGNIVSNSISLQLMIVESIIKKSTHHNDGMVSGSL